MTGIFEPNWKRCTEPGCNGSRIASEYCLAHVGDWRDVVDSSLKKHGGVDLRGTVLEQGVVEYIIRAYGKLGKPATIYDGILRADCDLSSVEFSNGVKFVRTEFRSESVLSTAQTEGEITLDHVLFSGARSFGPIVAEHIEIKHCKFDRQCDVRVISNSLNMTKSDFVHGCNLNVYSAAMNIVDVSFGDVTLISTTAVSDVDPLREWIAPGEGLKDVTSTVLSLHAERRPASLLYLSQVDVGNLTLSGVNLSNCRISNVHNLDKLNLEDVNFLPAPKHEWDYGLARSHWRNSRRQVLFDEAVWRQARHPKSHWKTYLSKVAPGTDKLQLKPNSPDYTAGLYRRLRKAREDSKDEPGAADFYYGEMEMRRHSEGNGFGARLLMTLYWALSGYGLRATRSMVALLLVLTLGVIGFLTFGFDHATSESYVFVWDNARSSPAYEHVTTPGEKPGLSAAISYTIESATSLIRSPQSLPLTDSGTALEVFLRIIGPTLLGLTILALRNRVKR
jgi:hypothetical protein